MDIRNVHSSADASWCIHANYISLTDFLCYRRYGHGRPNGFCWGKERHCYLVASGMLELED
jgi:hypothetical protein